MLNSVIILCGVSPLNQRSIIFLISSIGTTKIKNLDNNIGALGVKLTKEDLKEISDMVPINDVAGLRTTENFYRSSWEFASTPPKDCKI